MKKVWGLERQRKVEIMENEGLTFEGGILYLHGVVGWDITASAVQKALSGYKDNILVVLNSGGGSATEGVAIYNALRRHSEDGYEVTVEVDGIAASAASMIAMAGDVRSMRTGTLMMIHEPWVFAFGTGEDLRKTADVLDKHVDSYAALYAERTGIDEQEIRQLMADETWMSPKDAKELGFVTEDEITEELSSSASAFAYGLYKHAPKDVMVSAVAEEVMAQHLEKGTHKVPENKTPVAKAAIPAAKAEPNSSSGDAVAAERKRSSDITDLVARCNLPSALAAEMVKAGLSLEDAQAKVIEQLAEKATEKDEEGPQAHRVNIVADEVEKREDAIVNGQLARFGIKADSAERNEFTSMRLSDLTRAHIEYNGQKVKSADRAEMFRQAMSVRASLTHTTGDFSHLMSNLANKVALVAYNETPETWRPWCTVGTLNDYKLSKRAGANPFPNLIENPEGAEIEYGTIGDRGETIQLRKYSRIVGITEEVQINDDLSEIVRTLQSAGRAAARLEGDLAYGVLTANGNLSDGVALFHADHGNYVAGGSGGAPSVTTLAAAEAAMATQTIGDATAGVRPRFILVPVALRATAAQLMASEHDPAKTSRAANPFRDYVEVIADPRLDAADAAAWYLAADPTLADTVEVSFLEGQQTPQIDQMDGFDIAGIKLRVLHRVGAAARGYRGLYFNDGN